MITLAFDTSGPVGSVAVLRGEEGGGSSVLATETIGDGMRHGVDLFPALERCLRGAGVTPRQVDLVAVGTGPGSYTGLRVGVTAARAFAYAAGARLLGVPSCDAWAAATPVPADDRPLAVVLDAKVRAVYVAVYRPEPGAAEEPDASEKSGTGASGAGNPSRVGGWRRTFGPELLPPEEAASVLPRDARVVGDGIAPYAASFPAVSAESGPDRPVRADAADVARLALRRDARGERDAIEAVVPLYLRAFQPATPTVDRPRIPDAPPPR